MRKLLAYTLLLVFLLSFTGCGDKRFLEADFIGKSSAQIEAEFGSFDCLGNVPDTDGLFRNTSCGYTLRAPSVGFLGTEPEVLFYISFDEYGIAYKCYEGYRPGG